ncbi:unnamed protein product [Didymodactylos carnosus]|uniref:Riboflavin kinase domain-containing protein n=1 Tax=Didymodactylos carnosus TaxID=1234261 RepID=A0A813SQ84_9BILA|nr:unnamed protein product [Didymodactylos carnosus]CAF0800600.1 unnamed protein product [Didymodactylos carnosus]CAF3495900.1 unnamed protein product [Didymodactylos carnosus]CAF3585591.1 unnamed protein product [Didymodactylos carnosus]
MNNANHWLSKYAKEYKIKTGLEQLYPGSLNVRLISPQYYKLLSSEGKIIIIEKEEFGWQRQIIMKPCRVFNRLAYIWRTNNGERDDTDLLELITDCKLRDEYGVRDGDEIIVEVDECVKESID